MGNYELPIFYSAGTNGDKSTLGDSDYPLVTATTSITNKWGYSNTSATGANSNSANTSALTGGLDLKENDRFIVTNLDKDLSDIDTAYYEVDKIHWDGTDVSVQLKDLIGTNDLTFDSTSDTPSVGNIDMSLVQVNSTHVYLAFSGSGTVSYNTAVSKTGLEVTLPAKNDIQTLDLSSGGAGQALTFTEANKDGDLGAGMKFTATVAATSASNDDLEVTDTNVTTLEDSRSSKVYMGYVPSDLASKVTFDKSGDENTFDIAYYGTEATADVQVIGGVSTTSSGSNVLGNILVKDSEVSSVATKNLIVVGGSCINSAAAALVGGAKCGAAWTTATGIGTGQFLIKGYATSTLTSGVALLVAGYDAEDTVKATTYLTNKVVDTSKTYQGTTTTETAVVID
jgi:hypothetical protein